jgi:hypothetical protein
MSDEQLSRRQLQRREQLRCVQAWRLEKVSDTREEQINQAWRHHRAYLRTSDEGSIAATSADVSDGSRDYGQHDN